MNPIINFIQVDEENWKIEASDFQQLRNSLGDELLTAFCRCFVHADRLVSLLDFLSQQNHDRKSVRYLRNFTTIIWFSAGTLRELSFALRDLRSQLAQQKLLVGPWEKLQETEMRWHEPYYDQVRTKMAFHVDKDYIRAGLEKLSRENNNITLMEGREEKQVDCSLRIGSDALWAGSHIPLSEEDINNLLNTMKEDHQILFPLQEVFAEVLQQKGLLHFRQE